MPANPLLTLPQNFFFGGWAVEGVGAALGEFSPDGIPDGPDVVFPVEQVRDMRRISYLDDLSVLPASLSVRS